MLLLQTQLSIVQDCRCRHAKVNCASAQKAACYSSCNHSSQKWSLPKKVSMLGQRSIMLVGGVQGSAPQREQLHVHKSRYPHFARALRKRQSNG